jgi:hypothetical protein
METVGFRFGVRVLLVYSCARQWGGNIFVEAPAILSSPRSATGRLLAPPVRLSSWVEATSMGCEGKATAWAHYMGARLKAMRDLPYGMPKYVYLIPVALLWFPSEV